MLNFGETSQPVNDGKQDPNHTINDRGQSNDNHRKESTGDSFTKQPLPGEGPPLQHPQDPGKNAPPDNHTINDQVQSSDNNHTEEDNGDSLTKHPSPGGEPPLQNPQDSSKKAPPDIHTIEKTSMEGIIDASSFSNILMKELVKSSIRSFKGNPGEYRGWKESFKQATKELRVESHPRIYNIIIYNIIISNIDGDTKSLIKRISDIHVSDPSLGLQRIWAYLDKRHGAKEAVEKELMNKLENFPRIYKNDSKKAGGLWIPFDGGSICEGDQAVSWSSSFGLIKRSSTPGRKIARMGTEKVARQGIPLQKKKSFSLLPTIWRAHGICSRSSSGAK